MKKFLELVGFKGYFYFKDSPLRDHRNAKVTEPERKRLIIW